MFGPQGVATGLVFRDFISQPPLRKGRFARG
jgi:hypothetical protein